MTDRRTIILNSLLTLILVASIYQFTRSEDLTREVGSIDRNTQHAQRQISELKEAASATFEQTMRRFDEFGRQLGQIAPARKSASTSTIVAAPPKPDLSNSPTVSNPPQTAAAVSRPHPQPGQSSQNVCDFPCYRHMLLPMLSKIVESAGYKVVKDPNAGAAQSIDAALRPAQIPYDQRRTQEAKLNRDLLDFLQMRVRVCETGTTRTPSDEKIARCSARTQRLAHQGNSVAQKWLGIQARDKQQNLQMAIFWFEQAADQGDAEAMDYLAAIYAGGVQQIDQTVSDTMVDPMKTLYWYSKSVSLGDANAMAAIAGIYQEGRLIPQDQHEAVVWYEMAAKAVVPSNKGRIASANFAGVLGDIYYNATGVEQDKLRAYQWYAIACADTVRLNLPADSSCMSRNNVANELNPVDVAKAQAVAAEWEKMHR